MPTASPSLSRPLDRLRGVRAVGAFQFVTLLLLGSAERRLSEAHYNYMSATPGLESADRTDGDEIKIRLILNADACVPDVGVALDLVAFWRPACRVVHRTLPSLDAHSPRAPPRALHG